MIIMWYTLTSQWPHLLFVPYCCYTHYKVLLMNKNFTELSCLIIYPGSGYSIFQYVAIEKLNLGMFCIFCEKRAIRTSEMCSSVDVIIVFIKILHPTAHGQLPWNGLWIEPPMYSYHLYFKITYMDFIHAMNLGVCKLYSNNKIVKIKKISCENSFQRIKWHSVIYCK